MEKSTELLQSELKKAKNPAEFFEENMQVLNGKTVQEFLLELLIKYDLERKEVAVKSGLTGTYPYQIFDGKKAAGRDKLIQLAFGFPLSLDETQHLLKYGGHNELYVKVKRDAYVMFALEKRYDIHKLNELLFECGEKPFE